MATDEERVRQLVGERIPDGGADTDTLFTSAEISDLLIRYSGDVTQAVGEAWSIKAGALANLVNSAEGTSKRDFSDLLKNALLMAQQYGTGGGGANSYTRIHEIVRP